MHEKEGKPMTSNSPEILRDREKSLEDEFFRREDKRLIERLNELEAAEVTREALAKASGVTKPAVLDRADGIGNPCGDDGRALTVPLVEVAWADGTLDAKERRVVVDRAGVARDSTAGALLEACSIAARIPSFLPRGRIWSRELRAT